MSAKFLALALLVQLYGAGQAAMIEAIKRSNSNEPGRNDGVSKDVRTGELTLTSFTWSYSSSDRETSLTVCSLQPFEGLDQTLKQVTLLITISGAPGINCEGVFDGVAKNCATFTETRSCALDISSESVTYTLEVTVLFQSTTEVNKSGTASFVMTVEAATLTCGSKTFIRATGVTNAVIQSCVAPGVEDVCYASGNLFVEPFCFTVVHSVPDGLILCLEGDNHATSTANGVLSIDQLAYKPVGSATFSLTHTNSDTAMFEAIVLKEKVPLQSCAVTPVADSGTCTIDFTRGLAEYEVCTLLPVDGGFQTAISSITDLDVQAEGDAASLQFRFTNANPDMMYKAKIEAETSSEVSSTVIDCTGVAQDHICYGFLAGSIPGTFLTIEYLAADGVTTSNKIAIPTPVLTSL